MRKGMTRVMLAGTLALGMVGGAMAQAQAPGAAEDHFLGALVAKRSETQRDNALAHYQAAFLQYPGPPPAGVADLIKGVVERGWTQQADSIAPYALAWEPALARIRVGVAVNDAYGLGAEMGADTPVPNFLFVQNAAQMFVVHGRRHAATGNNEAAVREYLYALSMGRDYGTEGNMLISALVSTQAQNLALDPLRELVEAGGLNANQLAMIQRVVGHMDSNHRGVVSAIEVERAISAQMMSDMANEFRQMNDASFPSSHVQRFQAIGIDNVRFNSRSEAVQALEATAQELNAYWDAALQAQRSFNADAYKARMRSPIARQLVSDTAVAFTREVEMVAKRKRLLESVAQRAGGTP